MKKLLFLIWCMLPMISLADSWDNLTQEQANNVVKELEKNPYLLDYCDCCSPVGEYATPVYLVKVMGWEVVTCEWDPNYFSIKLNVKRIAQITYLEKGIDLNNLSPMSMDEETDKFNLSMNYTWGYNAEKNLATPFFCIVDYDVYGENETASGLCRPFVNFPNPNAKEVKAVIKEKQYKKWYRKKA